MNRVGAIALAILTFLSSNAATALAWDSRTHREITHLAIERLPPSPLKDFFVANDERLREFSVEPDSILKRENGKAERIRHYIDIEDFGADPFNALTPDIHAMERKFGAATMIRAGTLPWTIDEISNALRDAWSHGDCAQVLRLAGYLAHYVGDASQPLHSTMLYDGYPRDRGMHARIELAVDQNIDQIGAAASIQTKLMPIDSVWPATIAEIREANTHVQEFIQADRDARASDSGTQYHDSPGNDSDSGSNYHYRGSYHSHSRNQFSYHDAFDSGSRNGYGSPAPESRSDYDAAFLRREKPLIVSEVADAASVLASIWLLEWHRAASPTKCASQSMSRPAIEH